MDLIYSSIDAVGAARAQLARRQFTPQVVMLPGGDAFGRTSLPSKAVPYITQDPFSLAVPSSLQRVKPSEGPQFVDLGDLPASEQTQNPRTHHGRIARPVYLSALLPLDIRRLVRFEKGAGDALLPLPAPKEHAFVVKERYKASQMLPGTKAPATYNFAIPLADLVGRDKELHQRLVEFNKRRMGSSLMFSNQETNVLSVTGVNAVLAEMENRWHSNFQPTSPDNWLDHFYADPAWNVFDAMFSYDGVNYELGNGADAMSPIMSKRGKDAMTLTLTNTGQTYAANYLQEEGHAGLIEGGALYWIIGRMPLEAGQTYDYQFWNDVESKRKGHLHHVVQPVDRGDADAVAPRNVNPNIPAGHGKTVWAIQVAQVCVPEGDELPAEYTEPVPGQPWTLGKKALRIGRVFHRHHNELNYRGAMKPMTPADKVLPIKTSDLKHIRPIEILIRPVTGVEDY